MTTQATYLLNVDNKTKFSVSKAVISCRWSSKSLVLNAGQTGLTDVKKISVLLEERMIDGKYDFQPH